MRCRYVVYGFFFMTAAVHAQQLSFKYYTLDQGFPHAQVWDVCQDRNGFLWFATGGGLVKYNGVSYQVYGKDDGLISNIIRSVYQDDDGKLWLTSDDGVAIFDGETFENYTHRDGLGEGFVWKTIKDREGQYWFPTSQSGVYRFDGKRFLRFGEEQGLPSIEWRHGFIDRRGHVWVAGDGGLFRMVYREGRYDDRFEDVSAKGPDAFRTVNHITQDRTGRLLISSSRGLLILDAEAYDKEPAKGVAAFVQTYTTRDGLPDMRIQAAMAASDSTIWAVTERGLAKWVNGTFESYMADENITSNSMHNIFEDREGTLWIGTDGGGCIAIPYQNMFSYTVRDGLSSRVVNAVTGDGHGRVFVGSDNGIDVIEKERLRPLLRERFVQGDPVWALKYGRGDTLWIGTRGRLLSYAQGRLTDHQGIFRKLSSPILDIEQDSVGRLWLGTLDGVVVVDGSRTWVINRDGGLPGNQVWCVYCDRQGVMWAGVNGGLVRFVPGAQTGQWTCRTYTTVDGLIDNTVNVVRQDRSGAYWIGTDMGLSRFDGTRFENLKAKQLGLGDNIVPVIEMAGDGMLWIGSKGYVKIDPGVLPPLVLRRLDKNKGMPGDETTTNNSFYIDPSGDLWIGTFSGLSHFTERPAAGLPPLVHIESVRIADSTMSLNLLMGPVQGPMALKSNAVSFSFAAVSFLSERDNVYQYRLDGFDESWSPFSSNNEVRYTNLPPGAYTIRVRARNSEFVESETEATLAFTIPTPFWLNPFFIVFAVLAAFGLALGAHRFRVNRKMDLVNRRNRELEEKVKERTAALIRQNSELEDILDKLRRTQGQLVQSEKMAALGQLVAGVAHEINNPTSILAGNVNYIEEYLRILKRMIAKYEEFNIADPEFLREMAELKHQSDWEFVQNDIDMLIASVKNAAERIRHIVLDLRNFSRLDEAEINEVSVHECVDTTVKLFMNQYRHVLSIDRDFRATRLVYCYVNQLNQVLLNLLINGAQAIEKKAADLKDTGYAGRIAIATEDDGHDGVAIHIRDNGCGIPHELRDRIFDPFFTTKPIGQGTGLGLSISYAIIVEKHNGTLSFESEPGQWTEFVIRLPYKPHEIPS